MHTFYINKYHIGMSTYNTVTHILFFSISANSVLLEGSGDWHWRQMYSIGENKMNTSAKAFLGDYG